MKCILVPLDLFNEELFERENFLLPIFQIWSCEVSYPTEELEIIKRENIKINMAEVHSLYV